MCSAIDARLMHGCYTQFDVSESITTVSPGRMNRQHRNQRFGTARDFTLVVVRTVFVDWACHQHQ